MAVLGSGAAMSYAAFLPRQQGKKILPGRAGGEVLSAALFWVSFSVCTDQSAEQELEVCPPWFLQRVGHFQQQNTPPAAGLRMWHRP